MFTISELLVRDLIDAYAVSFRDIVCTADIVVAAVGIPNYIKGNWIKTGAVVVDCGINQIKDSTKK